MDQVYNHLTNGWTVLLVLLFSTVARSHFGGLHYVPSTGNIAIGRLISTTSTCGLSGDEQYFSRTDAESCGICNSMDTTTAHPANNMIDYDTQSWWQSQNNVENVTIDLDFEKLFFFTHVLVSFRSLRPSVMSLEKSNDGGVSYEHVMSYSVDCDMEDVPCTSSYSLPTPGDVIYEATETVPNPDLSNASHVHHFTITNLRLRLSQLPPLLANNPANIPVSPWRYYAIDHVEVYGWCFCNGHEDSCVPSVMEASTDGMVPSLCICSNGTTGTTCNECGQRNGNGPWSTGFSPSVSQCDSCQCNGHASMCYYNASLGESVCLECGHNTDGDSCERCENGYYRNSEVPMSDPNTCIKCNCNPAGVLPDQPLCIHENTDMYTAGTCLCRDNVTGSGCDQCGAGFRAFNGVDTSSELCEVCSCPNCEPHTGRCPCDLNSSTDCCPFDQYFNATCTSCDCDPIGSVGTCDLTGNCICKPGVGGVKCNQCLEGYYNMSDTGCSPCGCGLAGSVNKSCDQSSGQCNCRDNVGGVKCDTCLAGYLGPLPASAAKTCIECFCNGYSFECQSEAGWYWARTVDTFDASRSSDEWSSNGDIEYDENSKLITASISSVDTNRLIVQLPQSYFEDKRTSYGLYMDMTFAIPSAYGNIAYLEILGDILKPSRKLKTDFKLDDDNTEHKVPMLEDTFTVRRYRHDSRSADQGELREILSAIRKMRLVVIFGESIAAENKYINISYVGLPYALKDSAHSNTIQPLSSAPVGEDCSCPVGRTGPRCQSCSGRYTTDPTNGNEFSSCVRCVCFGYSDTCNPVTGQCVDCTNGTAGVYCELCADGYYRDPATDRCFPCNCPGGPGAMNQFGGQCSADGMGGHMCDCPIGYIGAHCETCQSGFVGDPTYPNGSCSQCRCTGNSPGIVDSCDAITGDCVCDVGFVGEECDLCDLGYYGDPLAHNCTSCNCNPAGSLSDSICDLVTGECVCRDNVIGRDCSRCVPNHWGLSYGFGAGGCVECNCSVVGSVSMECNEISGVCECREGHFGRACDSCQSGYWQTPNGTCTPCNCHPLTSHSQICSTTGECSCRQGSTGDRCDRCTSDTSSGILPHCEFCGQCSARWISPIDELELTAINAISIGNNVSINVVNHTEIEEGRMLVSTLYDLLNQIRAVINQSMLDSLRVSVTSLNVYTVGSVDIAVNLLERINVILGELNYTSMIVTMQLVRLDTIESDFRYLKTLLSNLSMEINMFELPGFEMYVTIIERALLRSNESHRIASEVINPMVLQSTNNLNMFTSKESLFILIRDEVIDLFTIFEARLQDYNSLFNEANERLCGSTTVTSDINTDICDGECGGVTCDMCGGGTCAGSVSAVSRASNLSTLALEQARRLRESLIEDLNLLMQANTTSLDAAVTHETVQSMAQLERLRIERLLVIARNLSDLLNALLARQLPDLEQIGLYQNQTFLISISQTPEQIIELLVSINDTIDLFPFVLNVNGTDLRRRAERALDLSRQANNTLRTILGDIIIVMENLETFRTQRTRVTQDIIRTRNNQATVDATTGQAKVLLNLAEQGIQRARVQLETLNSSLLILKESFDINLQRLRSVQGRADTVEDRTIRLQNNVTSAGMRLGQLNETIVAKLQSAKETFVNVTVLRDRLIQLRNTSHTQMLRARGLANLKECIVARQSHIRDDIHRVGAELERLHREIEMNVGRNTVCLRRTGTAK